MKTNIFKVVLSIVFTMFVSYGVFAQTIPGGNPPGGWVANEDLVGEVDTVTLSARMEYFVVPDPVLNPAYTGVGDEADLVSRWAWTFNNAAVGTDVTVVSPGGLPLNAAYNNIEVTFVTKGIVSGPGNNIEIQTAENYTPTYGSTCGGGSTSSAFVHVIDEPTGYFDPGPLANYQLSYCISGADTTAVLPVIIETQSDTSQVEFRYDISGSATASDVTVAVDNNPVSGITWGISIAALGVGDYTVTLDRITDRISRKCNSNTLNALWGDVTSGPAGSDVFQFSISTKPITGKIYHIAN